jgi:linoleoyl-CoA desaturase
MSYHNQPAFEVKKIRYESSDTPEHIYRKMRQGAEQYFKETGLPKHATVFMAYKMTVLVICMLSGYYALTQAYSFATVFMAYFLLTFASLLLSINLGHDAAHHAVTGNTRIDNFIFQAIFALQGLSGYVWQIRHNYSHHVLPNVKEHDSDMEMTHLILLEPDPAKAKWYHAYQHIYAPFLYAFVSLQLLFVQDFKLFLQKDQANLHLAKIPLIEWVKMLTFKVFYFGFTFGIPLILGSLQLWELVTAWLLVHAIVSIFVAFTFFISHHVTELEYIEPNHQQQIVADSWIRHQITTTIDFNPESRFANFIFGGFNIHVAHHVFPEVSHEHYPALTKIIRNILSEHGLDDWYQSYTFQKGCVSHLRHLKNITKTLKINQQHDFNHHLYAERGALSAEITE